MMMMTDDSITSQHKRRQCLSSTTPTSPRKKQHRCLLKISDLPDESLEVISTFLPGYSRALFAVAMTAPSHSTPRGGVGGGTESPWKTPKLKATNQAILSMRDSDLQNGGGGDVAAWWTEVVFGEDDPDVLKLNDNDLHAALICIDAVNRLESLVIDGCSEIIGSGLEPLRGSTVLREIILSCGWDPPMDFHNTFRTEIVIPILESIIDTPGNSLRNIHLPRSFREKPSAIVEEFQTKFAELLEAVGYNCPRCGRLQNPGDRDDEDREFCVYDPEGTKCTGYYCMGCYVRLYDRWVDY